MKFFRSKKNTSNNKPKDTVIAQAVGFNNDYNPFGMLNSYVPLGGSQDLLYEALREGVPVIDSAIEKIVRLIGTFEISCADVNAEKGIKYFLENIKTDSNNIGFKCFISSYFDRLLTYGTAVAEIVPYSDYSGIYGIYNADNSNIVVKCDSENPLELNIYARRNCELVQVDNKDLILMTSLKPQPNKPMGKSILSGLPFVSNILIKIMKAVGQNWDRAGNIRFAVTYKPPIDGTEGVYTQQRAELIAKEWSKAMTSDKVSDFIAVGDVDIKVIGADNQILDCQTPARLMLEQIVSKLSIPPFLLGFSWSSTERMSSQQADILTSELEYYRELLNPVIHRICRLWLSMNGYSSEHEIVWSNINLQDEVELAEARLNNARAKQIEQQLNGKE